MLPCMSDDLINYLGEKGISSVQELLNIPEKKWQKLFHDLPNSDLYQVIV